MPREVSVLDGHALHVFFASSMCLVKVCHVGLWLRAAAQGASCCPGRVGHECFHACGISFCARKVDTGLRQAPQIPSLFDVQW